MYFGFDDDQLAFRDAVRDLLDKECPPEVVRAAWEAPPGQLDRRVWDQLAEMGVLGLLVPDDQGGLGLDEQALVLILEESGRAALPHPIVETAAVTAPLLGSRLEPGTLVASDLGGPNVPCAADADRLLLQHPEDGAVYLVEPAAVSLTPVDPIDGARRAARVAWDGDPAEAMPDEPAPEIAVPTAISRAGSDAVLISDDPEVVDRAFDRGAWGTAAQLLGLGQRMLDLTVAYVQEREQFGQPIGAFQAVKHRMADALKELAFARPAVYRAAHSLAVGAPTVARDVSMAKAMASDAAWFVSRQALQCHGAIGYTVEADLQLYMKRTWALARAWGDAAWHRNRVGIALHI